MKFSILRYFICVVSIISFYQCRSNKEESVIRVFCAAGVSDVITELSDSFKINHNVDIKLNLASSGTLAKQLAFGNKSDIYISASKHWADYADSLGLFSDRKLLYRNRLVFVTPLNSSFDSIDFTELNIPKFHGRLSIGDPAHVPAGQYAKEALKNLGWWERIENRTLPAKDVRSALIPVELGESELGIVYYSDALASKKIKIAGIFPEGTHTPVIIHALLAKESNRLSAEFYQMLNNNNFEEVWIKYGLSTAIEN